MNAIEVLCRYPAAQGSSPPTALGNRGGFSGARLWRVEGPAGAFCLRAWPPAAVAPARLRAIHRLMEQAGTAGLHFVPAVSNTSDGATWVEHAGRLWDLTAWLPGRADFHKSPSVRRLNEACQALGRVHKAWAETGSAVKPCPAVQRRLARAGEWLDLVAAGWRPDVAAIPADPVQPWVARAWPLLLRHVPAVPRKLAGWIDRPVLVQPCLCDVWHDHLLYEGENLTGLVDYGSVKADHPAVDLARMLGSLVGDDASMREAGLRAYARWRPLSPDAEGLVAVLDETGTVLGAVNWLLWLYHEDRTFEDRAAVTRRLAVLVERMETWG